jgi:two-component system, cell cycle sensor histidine kinase and response regulator CckA
MGCGSREANGCERLFFDLASLIRTSGPYSAPAQVISLNTVVRHVEPALILAVQPGIMVERRLYEELDPISADPAVIERLILALARGAREAMPKGGTLTIETDTVFLDKDLVAGWKGMLPGAYSMLLVRDTRTARRDSVGMNGTTAADLDEARAIAEEAGGRVDIELIPGTGRVCRAYFPTVDVEPQARNEESQTVLLVDDTDSVRDMIERLLTGFGYHVLVARDGAQALEVSDKHQGQIDLLLSDVVMPGIGGPELAIRLRMRRPTLRVLLMSGYDEHSFGAGGMSYSSFIAKPFRAETLHHKILEVLGIPERARPVS